MPSFDAGAGMSRNIRRSSLMIGPLLDVSMFQVVLADIQHARGSSSLMIGHTYMCAARRLS
jgi:hypothetical protein